MWQSKKLKLTLLIFNGIISAFFSFPFTIFLFFSFLFFFFFLQISAPIVAGCHNCLNFKLPLISYLRLRVKQVEPFIDEMAALNGIGYILNDRASALASYPHARKINNFLYISGISSRRPDGTYVGVMKNTDGTVTLDIKDQTRAVLENIESILRESCGLDRRSLVDLTVFLLNMEDYGAFNEVYNTFFESSSGPTRTTVAVKSLPSPNLLIEIKAIAYSP